MIWRRIGVWVVFSAFIFAAMYFHDGESLFVSHGPYAAGKTITWFIPILLFANQASLLYLAMNYDSTVPRFL
jgi:hypothetical protein